MLGLQWSLSQMQWEAKPWGELRSMESTLLILHFTDLQCELPQMEPQFLLAGLTSHASAGSQVSSNITVEQSTEPPEPSMRPITTIIGSTAKKKKKKRQHSKQVKLQSAYELATTIASQLFFTVAGKKLRHLFTENYSHFSIFPNHNHTFPGILLSMWAKVASWNSSIMTEATESLFVCRSSGQCSKRLNTSVACGGQLNSLNTTCTPDMVRLATVCAKRSWQHCHLQNFQGNVNMSSSDLQLAVRILVYDEPAVCMSSGCFQNSCNKTLNTQYC